MTPMTKSPIAEMLELRHLLEGAVICTRLAKDQACRAAESSDGSPESNLRLQWATDDLKAAMLAEEIATRRLAEWRSSFETSEQPAPGGATK